MNSKEVVRKYGNIKYLQSYRYIISELYKGRNDRFRDEVIMILSISEDDGLVSGNSIEGSSKTYRQALTQACKILTTDFHTTTEYVDVFEMSPMFSSSLFDEVYNKVVSGSLLSEKVGVSDMVRIEDIALNFGGDYTKLVIEPTLSEAVNAASAEFIVEEFVSKREELAQAITESVTDKLSAHGILVNDIAITDHVFNPEYEKAVGSVKIAQQKTKADLEELEQAKIKAESNKLFADAYTKENYMYEFVKAWSSGNAKLPQVISEDALISLMSGEMLEKVAGE